MTLERLYAMKNLRADTGTWPVRIRWEGAQEPAALVPKRIDRHIVSLA